MTGEATISADVLATYAADAAREVAGVRALAESHLPGRRGVRIASVDGGVRIELHLALEWGAAIPAVGRAVQEQVRDYLGRMADVEIVGVDVVVDEVGPVR